MPGRTVLRLENVAVARRKALRGSGLLAIQQAGAASKATQRALRRAASPHVSRGEMLTPRTLRRREMADSCFEGMTWSKKETWLFDMLNKRRAERHAPSLQRRSRAVGRAGVGSLPT